MRIRFKSPSVLYFLIVSCLGCRAERSTSHSHLNNVLALQSEAVRLSESGGDWKPLCERVRKATAEIPRFEGREASRSLNDCQSENIRLQISNLLGPLIQDGQIPALDSRSAITFKVKSRNDEKVYTSSDPSRLMWIRIQNLSQHVLAGPRLVFNRQKDWFDVPSILSEALRGARSEREKAVALWAFVTQNRVHGPHSHFEHGVYSPVRLLNAFGYALCDDAAVNLVVLAQAAGMSARGWTLTGHIVCEIQVNGSWAMFDPDGEIYAVARDGQTIMGVEDIVNDPDQFVKGATHPAVARQQVGLYTSVEDNAVAPSDRRPAPDLLTMEDTLRPGESFIRYRRHWGKFLPNAGEVPPRYANGFYQWEPDWAAGFVSLPDDRASGVIVHFSTSSASLQMEPSSVKSEIVWSFSSPYPYVNASAVVRARILSPGATLKLDCSTDRVHWSRVLQMSYGDSGQQASAFGHLFRLGFDPPHFKFYLRVQMISENPRGLSLDHLAVVREVQLNPDSLPDLAKGENRIRFTAHGPSPISLEYSFSTESADLRGP